LGYINDESLWNIYISRPDIKTLKAEFSSFYKYDANIIITWPREGEVLPDLLHQIEYITLDSLWNLRAQFLVVMMYPSSSPEVLAQDVLENIWKKFMIVDILLLIPDWKSHLTDSGNCNLNDPVRDIKSFSLFTWYPFKRDNQLNLVDIWGKENEGRFLRQADLFPSKIPKNFNGSYINVSAVAFHPVLVYNGNYTDERNQTKYNFTGIEILFLHLITNALNLQVSYQPPGPSDDRVGRTHAAVSDLMFGRTDLAVGGLIISDLLFDLADCLSSYFMSGMKAFVPCPQPVSRLHKISQIFALSAWLGIFFVLVLVSVTFLYLAKPPYKKHIHETQHYRTVSNCFYNIWAVTLGVPVTEQPRSDKLRAVFVLFVWYSFAVSTVFQTFLTSVLVDPGVEKQISSIDELLSSGLEYGYFADYDYFYFGDDSTDWTNAAIRANRKNCTEQMECIRRVIENRDFVAMDNEILVAYFVANNYPETPNLLCTMDEYIVVTWHVMCLQKGGPFLEIFSEVVRRLVESGLAVKTYTDTVYSWRLQALSKVDYSGSEDYSDSEYFVFSVWHLQIAFLILMVGFSCSLFFLIFEVLHAKLF
jgi:hypothetical protein